MFLVVVPTGKELTAFTVTVSFLVVSFGTSTFRSPTRTEYTDPTVTSVVLASVTAMVFEVVPSLTTISEM